MVTFCLWLSISVNDGLMLNFDLCVNLSNILLDKSNTTSGSTSHAEASSIILGVVMAFTYSWYVQLPNKSVLEYF